MAGWRPPESDIIRSEQAPSTGAWRPPASDIVQTEKEDDEAWYDPALKVGQEFGAALARSTLDLADSITGMLPGSDILEMHGIETPTGREVLKEVGVQDHYMDPGLARDIVSTTGDMLPSVVPIAKGVRGVASISQKAPKTSAALASGSTKQDIVATGLSAAGAEVGEDIDIALGGEGNIGRLIGGVVVPGAGVAGVPGKAGRQARKAGRKAAKESEQVYDLSRVQYQARDNSKEVFQPAQVGGFRSDLEQALRKEGYKPSLSKKTKRLLKEFDKDYPPGTVLTPEDLGALRHRVGKVLGKSDDDFDRSLAAPFKNQIDSLMDQAPIAGKYHREANRLYRQASATEMIETLMYNASLKGGGDKAIRAEMRNMLRKNKKGRRKHLDGWTDDEIAALEKATKGGTIQNLLAGFRELQLFGVIRFNALQRMVGAGANIPARRSVKDIAARTSLGPMYPEPASNAYVTDLLSGIRAGVIGQNIPE